MRDKIVDGMVRVDPARKPDRLASARHRIRQRRRDEADALAHVFVVAVAPQPRHLQAFGLKRQNGLVEQARVAGKPEGGLKQVAIGRAIRLPVNVLGPVGALHAFVAPGAGVGAHCAAVEQREGVGQLVALRVVDGVAGHRDKLQRRSGDRSHTNPVDGAHHGRDRMSVEHLLRTLHRQQLAKARVIPFAVEELETARRLCVGDVKVCQVGEARDCARNLRSLGVRLAGQVGHRTVCGPSAAP